MTVVKGCMVAACRGWYQSAIKLVLFLFKVKQIIKRIKSFVAYSGKV